MSADERARKAPANREISLPAHSPAAPPAADRARDPSRLPAVDALRGVAILLVFIYHAGPLDYRLAPYAADGHLPLPPLSLHSFQWSWLLIPFFHFGYVGVHAFFVISGFCIHLGAARRSFAPRPAPSLATFYLRRFYRIYPPYWVALAIFGLAVPACALALHHPRPVFPSLPDLLAHAAMLHTFFQSTIFSINNAWWSIATEEQFYLVYPLLALAFLRFGVRRLLVAALLLSLAWRAAVLHALPPTVAHFMFYRVWLHGFFVPRWYEWMLGCLLAEAVADPAAPLRGRRALYFTLSISLFAAAVGCRLHVVVDKLLSDSLFSSAFAALLAACLDDGFNSQKTPAHPSRAARLLGDIGHRAYGTYLIHQPILDAPCSIFLRVPVAVAASLLFSRSCERPFEEKSRRVGR